VSIIPVVFDQLLELYPAAPGLSSVQVRDSVNPSYAEGEWLLVGPDNDAATSEASDASTQRGGLTTRLPEVARVPCALWTATGDPEPAQHRARAFELFAAVQELHATNRNLSGSVNDAHIASWRFKARSGERGAGALITWVIQARKY
jgi:hypothetical protein